MALAVGLGAAAAQDQTLSPAHARMLLVLNDLRDKPMPKGDDAVLVYQCYLECNRLLPKMPEVLHAKLVGGEIGDVVAPGVPFLPGDIHTFKQEGGRVTFGLHVEGEKFLTHEAVSGLAVLADLSREPWKGTFLATRRIIPADDTTYLPPAPGLEPSTAPPTTAAAAASTTADGGSSDLVWMGAAMLAAFGLAFAVHRSSGGAPKGARPPTVSDRLAALDGAPRPEGRPQAGPAAAAAAAPVAATPATPAAQPSSPADPDREREPWEDEPLDAFAAPVDPASRLRPETEADVLARLRDAGKPPRRG